MFIEIKNNGVMDLNALVLIGASTKRDDSSKIGYFGSGLKYALAVLLRNGIVPSIFVGQNKIDIRIEKREFREKIFNQIFIEGEPTSLTAEMGIDWEPWFAIREIYCNALDEGGAMLRMVDDISPEEGKTSIYVENTGIFNELLMNWDKYFNIKRTDIMLNVKGFKAFFGGDDYIIYRRGVRAHYEKRKSLYHYDCSDISINESRTLLHSMDYVWTPAQMVAQYADSEMIRNIYDNYADKIEEHFMWEQAQAMFNHTWLEVLGGRKIVIDNIAGHYIHQIREGGCIVLPERLARALKKTWPNEVHILGMSDSNVGFMEVDATARQKHYIETAKQFLLNNGYDCHYPIKVVVFEDKSVLGQAVGETVLLSVDVLEKGKRETAITLLEEFVHLEYGFADETRSMQNFLFDKVFALMEEKVNVFL